MQLICIFMDRMTFMQEADDLPLLGVDLFINISDLQFSAGECGIQAIRRFYSDIVTVIVYWHPVTTSVSRDERSHGGCPGSLRRGNINNNYSTKALAINKSLVSCKTDTGHVVVIASLAELTAPCY
ncbi:hypothetical protein M8C21_010739, partial [Ambrosia artemisiifolia]